MNMDLKILELWVEISGKLWKMGICEVWLSLCEEGGFFFFFFGLKMEGRGITAGLRSRKRKF